MSMTEDGLPVDLDMTVLGDEPMVEEEAMPSPSAPMDELTNLAAEAGEDELNKIGAQCVEEFEADDDSRAQWLEMHGKWMNLYYQRDKPKNPPYDWGSEESMPVLAEACNQFSARAYKAFFPNNNVVKVVPAGNSTRFDRQRADRVSKHLNWQLMVRDRNYKRNKRRMLLSAALHGSCFTKVYYDPIVGRNVVVNVRASDLVVPYGTGPRDLSDVERKTHVIWMTRDRTEALAAKGYFVAPGTVWENGETTDTDDAAAGAEGIEPTSQGPTGQDQCKILEQHRLLDLDGDGVAEPYIVTVDAETRKVLRLTIRWEPNDPEKTPVEHFVHYPFIENPDGFYGLGMGHLVGQINASVNKILRQSMDAATLANIGNHSGFVSESVAPGPQNINLELGKFGKIKGSAEDLARGIWSPSFPGPSQAMFEIMSALMVRSDRLASATEMLTGQSEKVMQPTTALALIEQGLEQYSSIYEGLFDAWNDELNKLYDLNSKYLDEQEYAVVLDLMDQPEVVEVTRADYAPDMQIVPMADPRMATEQQRMTRAEAEWAFVVNYYGLQLQMPLPQYQQALFNAASRYMEAIRANDVQEILVPPPPPPEPQRVDDPREENFAALLPEPKIPQVFADQNHLAHLREHMRFLSDPAWSEQPTPQGKVAMEKHIQMHKALLYAATETELLEKMDDDGGRTGGMDAAPGDAMVPGGTGEMVPTG